jgi:large subunit ribosomal protein L25
MKTVSLSGSSRENVGKKGATELRNQERIPAVLYGGKEQVHFSISENEAKKLVFTPNVYLIDLEVKGKKVKAIIQETQIHPVTDRILHIDFFEVDENSPFKVKLPVTLSGFSKGVRNGGRLRQNFRKLHVIGLVGDMPDDINIDITPLRIGHKKRVSDLSVSGLRFLDPSNAVVVGVQTARAAIEEEEEEGVEGEAAASEGEAAASEEGTKE